MSKAELLQELEGLSNEELNEVADRIDQLRGKADSRNISSEELLLVRDRVAAYRKNPGELDELDDVVAEILHERK